MPMFFFRARDHDGALATGEREAADAAELKQKLFSEGLIPLEVRARATSVSSIRIPGLRRRVSSEEMMLFTRQFATLFGAGVGMDAILGALGKQMKSKIMQEALTAIRTDIAAGATLSQSFGRQPLVFNEMYVAMLNAGEEAGILDEVLKQLSNLLAKEYEIQKNVKGALFYPKIVVTVLTLAVSFLMTFVVPKFVSFYAGYGAELPLPTKILMGISSVFHNYWYLLIMAAVGGFYVYHRYYRTPEGRLQIDALRLKMPVFGDLQVKIANARFGHILSALYRSGLAMPRSLEVVANAVGNAAFAAEVRRVRDQVQRGSTLSEALAKQGSFSPVMVETTAVGERAGALGEMLTLVAEHFDIEVDHITKNLTTLLEPLLIVSIFGMVLLLALAIYLPIWNLSQASMGKI